MNQPTFRFLICCLAACAIFASCSKKPEKKADEKPSREFSIIEKSKEASDKANERVKQVDEAVKNSGD